MTDRLLERLLRNRALLALIIAVATGLAAYYVYGAHVRDRVLAVDPGIDSLLPAHSPGRDLLARVHQRFGGDEALLVVWRHDALFTPERLARLKRFSRELTRLKGVERVESLATATAIDGDGDFVEVNEFLATLPTDAAAARALEDIATTNPLYAGNLVSRDGSAVLVVVYVDDDLDQQALAALAARVTTTATEAAGDIRSRVTGPLFARLEIGRLLQRDLLTVLPLAVIVTMVVAGVWTRSVRGVALPLVANSVAMVLTLAAFVAGGQRFNLITVILPPVLYVIGFAYAIHFLAAFERALRTDAGGESDRVRAAIRRAFAEVRLPLVLTVATTAIGFLALTATDIGAIRVFGAFAALATVLAGLATLTVLPLCLALAPVRVPAAAAAGAPPSASQAGIERLAAALLARRGWVIAAGAGGAVLSLLAATRIEVSTDYVSIFPADSRVRSGFAEVAEAFGGAVPLLILLETDTPGAFKAPDNLALVRDLQTWLDRQSEIGTTASLVDYVGLLHQALTPGALPGDRIPSSAEAVDQLLLFGAGPELDRFTDSRFATTLLLARTSAVATTDLNAVVERIEARLAALPPHIRPAVTSSSVVLAETVDEVTLGQVKSLLGAGLMIYLLLVVLFGSWRTGALALVPNFLPIVAFFGLLGLFGFTLNLTTSLVAAVVLGIAVDDTIHLLTRFNAEARSSADEREGLSRALRSVVRPVTLTTLALCAGFLTLCLSPLRNQFEFGLLAASTLLIAWVVDVTFTPAIAGYLRFVTIWESLTVDLGCQEPHKTIPLFDGLSRRQARLAALVGSFERYRPGDRVMSYGQTQDALRVVVSGNLTASVPHDDGAHFSSEFNQGDFLGSVALFHGTATADIDAVTEVQVLRLSDECLRHIQRRHPKIGAQLYRNIARFMADRFATVRKR